MIKAVLMDIEGTTTSISFVYDKLFPYAKKHLKTFLRDNVGRHPLVDQVVVDVMEILELVGPVEQYLSSVSEALLRWMDEDKKITPLKVLQGLIWEEGYKTGEILGHVYEDVPVAFKKWNEAGLILAIYSSGSVQAQNLLFGNSVAGNLSAYLSQHFDTTTGPKKASHSYTKIAQKLGCPASDVLFVSDVEAELDAAKEAGMQTVQVLREGVKKTLKHPVARNFLDIELS